jgi:hypothetical protein
MLVEFRELILGHQQMKLFTVPRLLAASSFAILAIAIAPVLKVEYTSAAWERRLLNLARETREASVDKLAGSQWEKIYLLQSYDLTGPISEELFGTLSVPWRYWWVGDAAYTTLVIKWMSEKIDYQKSTAPTLIRLSTSKWLAHQSGRVWTEGGGAKIRIFSKGDIGSLDWLGCRGTLKENEVFCLQLI